MHAGYRDAWRSTEMLDGIRVVRVKTFITRNERYLLRIVDYAFYAASAFVGHWHPLVGVGVPNRCLVAGLAGSTLATRLTWTEVL